MQSLNRKQILPWLALSLLLLAGPAFSLLAPEPPGGTGTVDDRTENAFGHPFAGADRDLRRQFFVGNAFFRDDWVTAPSSTSGRDGLGPTFNAISCSSCHKLDGRGSGYTKEGAVDISLLFRLSQSDGSPHPAYGDQFNPLAIDGVDAEGRVDVSWQAVRGTYPDGTSYELRQPAFAFRDLAFGELGPGVLVSPRVAPHLSGLGLLEAVREADILALADGNDTNGDGISGRPNWVWNRAVGRSTLGRFGWKANQPSLLQQNSGAFAGDIGITSSLFPDKNCPPSQAKCLAAPSGGEPEIQNQILARVTTYTQLLAVPNRRPLDPFIAERGEKKFREVGCASCHQPSFVTGDHELSLLAGQKIFPYTDLLLHDMGEALADHRPDGNANGREWRTPPLWGLGLVPVVNKHLNLLHDGRARGLEEAVLWHGGEAEATRRRFLELAREDREALLQFVNSL